MKNQLKEYWEKSTPMQFKTEKMSYLQIRTFRYELQNYMHDVFRFDNWNGKNVLEFGCGSGIDALEFARYGANVTAADITDNAIQQTAKNSAESGLNINLVKVDGDILPFNDGYFDCVYSFGVLHHIKNIDNTLYQIFRVLKPGGVFMGMVYNRDSLLYAYSIKHLHGNERGDIVSKYSERNIGCPYTKAYSETEVKQVFGRWFTDLAIQVRYNVIDLPEKRKLKLDIDDGYKLGWHLIIKGEKCK